MIKLLVKFLVKLNNHTWLGGGIVKIGEAVTKRVLELCSERKITLNKMATICGITQSTLDNMKKGNSKNQKISTIKKVCDGLNITIVDFFNRDYFLSLEQEIE